MKVFEMRLVVNAAKAGLKICMITGENNIFENDVSLQVTILLKLREICVLAEIEKESC